MNNLRIRRGLDLVVWLKIWGNERGEGDDGNKRNNGKEGIDGR